MFQINFRNRNSGRKFVSPVIRFWIIWHQVPPVGPVARPFHICFPVIFPRSESRLTFNLQRLPTTSHFAHFDCVRIGRSARAHSDSPPHLNNDEKIFTYANRRFRLIFSRSLCCRTWSDRCDRYAAQTIFSIFFLKKKKKARKSTYWREVRLKKQIDGLKLENVWILIKEVMVLFSSAYREATCSKVCRTQQVPKLLLLLPSAAWITRLQLIYGPAGGRLIDGAPKTGADRWEMQMSRLWNKKKNGRRAGTSNTKNT